VHRLVAALTSAVLLGVGTGCGPADACGPGENRICRDANDCRCGRVCNTMEDCTGRDTCAHFRSDPMGPGVCVDVLWLIDNPPCVPLCRENQVCVSFPGRANACQDVCTASRDCASGCCVPLNDGRRACAPQEFCRNAGCDPPCGDGNLCVLFSATPVCARQCVADDECGTSCCLPLDNGAGACSPNGAFCPSMPRPPCRTLEDCTRAEVRFTPAPMATCGMAGSYEGALLNACGEPAECRACWWSPATGSYSDCAPLGQIPSGATVPLDVTRCADVTFPDPPVRVRCIDEASLAGPYDCLGSGPL
jgi:hypothetical protein